MRTKWPDRGSSRSPSSLSAPPGTSSFTGQSGNIELRSPSRSTAMTLSKCSANGSVTCRIKCRQRASWISSSLILISIIFSLPFPRIDAEARGLFHIKVSDHSRWLMVRYLSPSTKRLAAVTPLVRRRAEVTSGDERRFRLPNKIGCLQQRAKFGCAFYASCSLCRELLSKIGHSQSRTAGEVEPTVLAGYFQLPCHQTEAR